MSISRVNQNLPRYNLTCKVNGKTLQYWNWLMPEVCEVLSRTYLTGKLLTEIRITAAVADSEDLKPYWAYPIQALQHDKKEYCRSVAQPKMQRLSQP